MLKKLDLFLRDHEDNNWIMLPVCSIVCFGYLLFIALYLCLPFILLAVIASYLDSAGF